MPACLPRQQLNMQPQIVNEYESGKAIPNNQVIAKIERALVGRLLLNDTVSQSCAGEKAKECRVRIK